MRVPLASILVRMPLSYAPAPKLLTHTARHDLLLCRQLRGHQCRDQYVLGNPPPDTPHPNQRAVANEQGSFTTPSFVSFTSEERLIGEAAKNQAAMNPENTVFDVKYELPASQQSPKNTVLTTAQASDRSPLRGRDRQEGHPVMALQDHRRQRQPPRPGRVPRRDQGLLPPGDLRHGPHQGKLWIGCVCKNSLIPRR